MSLQSEIVTIASSCGEEIALSAVLVPSPSPLRGGVRGGGNELGVMQWTGQRSFRVSGIRSRSENPPDPSPHTASENLSRVMSRVSHASDNPLRSSRHRRSRASREGGSGGENRNVERKEDDPVAVTASEKAAIVRASGARHHRATRSSTAYPRPSAPPSGRRLATGRHRCRPCSAPSIHPSPVSRISAK